MLGYLAKLCCLALLSGLIAFSVYRSMREPPPKLLTETNESYLEGESALTIYARELFYNKSLAALLQLEEGYQPKLGNGRLYYNIANTYYQLESYPRAVLYYYRAFNLRPFDQKVRQNLNSALKKLDLPLQQEVTHTEWIFFWHFLPLPWRLQFFFLMACIALVLNSLAIWKPLRPIKILTSLFGGFALLLFLSLGLTYFMQNSYAVAIQASNLYRGAGPQFALVGEEPIKPGTKMQVTQFEQTNQWVKVITPEGHIGFVPLTSLLLI